MKSVRGHIVLGCGMTGIKFATASMCAQHSVQAMHVRCSVSLAMYYCSMSNQVLECITLLFLPVSSVKQEHSQSIFSAHSYKECSMSAFHPQGTNNVSSMNWLYDWGGMRYVICMHLE